jgi:nucleoside-diphosphate-sugar epimerase
MIQKSLKVFQMITRYLLLSLSIIGSRHHDSRMFAYSMMVPSLPTEPSGSSAVSHRLLILGLGRVGLPIAELAAPSFSEIVGTVRSLDATQSLYANNNDDDYDSIDPCPRRMVFDPDEILKIIPGFSHVLITIPVQASLLPFFTQVYHQLALDAWLGLISTTGVYGNYDGGWVSEDSPCLCDTASNAYPYLELERFLEQQQQQQQQLSMNNQPSSRTVRIFRCAGIYGPGRSALHTVYQQGFIPESVDSENTLPQQMETVTNRIHTTDLVRAVVASMTLANNEWDESLPSFRIYNLADDAPESRSVVLHYACTLLQQFNKIPSQAPRRDGDGRRRRRRRDDESKRVDNQRMKSELVPVLQYPTYREGLAAIWADRTSPWWKAALLDTTT